MIVYIKTYLVFNNYLKNVLIVLGYIMKFKFYCHGSI